MNNRSVPTPSGADFEAKKHAYFAAQQQEARSGSLCGSANMAQPAQREIPATIGSLFGLTEQLSESIARFGSRLEPVLIARPCEIDSLSTAPASTEMGSQLAQLAARVDMMINAIHSLDAQLQI